MVNIALVAGGGPSGQVADLARALAPRGHRIRLYSRLDRPGPPVRLPVGPGLEVVYLPAGPPARIGSNRALRHMGEFGGRLAADWAADPPDVVHAHFWLYGLAALAAVRSSPVPVVQTFHGLGSVQRRRPGGAGADLAERIRLEAAISRAVDLVVATSAGEVDELMVLGLPRRAALVVPDGVDTEQFSPIGPVADRPTSRRRLVSVGRLAPGSGHEFTIAALRQVPDVELVIVGGPAATALAADPAAQWLRATAARHGVAGQVTLAGQVGNAGLAALLRSADLMVCPQRDEPPRAAVVEAMATGVPVVAVAAGGLADTVLDGVTGRLVTGNRPSALAAAVRQLLDTPAELGAYRAASHDRARSRYGWPQIATEIEAAYARVIRPTRVAVPG